MTWTPAPFTGGVIWQDKPSVATALDAANLNQEENAEAAYAVALSQSVVDHFTARLADLVRDYGAKPDAIRAIGSITTGTNQLTLAGVTTVDVGKTVYVPGAGANINLGATTGGVAVPTAYKGKINSVAGGVATMDTTASNPATNILCTYGTAIDTALDSAFDSGDPVYVPPGSYIMADFHTTKDWHKLYGLGPEFVTIYWSPGFSNLQPLSGTGLTGATSALTADAAIGAGTIAVTGTPPVVAGDYVAISSNALWEPQGTDADALVCTKGEIVRVQQVQGSTIYTEDPLVDTYTVAASAKVQKWLADKSDYSVSGIRFKAATTSDMNLQLTNGMSLSRYGGSSAGFNALLNFTRLRNVQVANVEVEGHTGSAVLLRNCLETEVGHCRFRDSSQQSAYGYCVDHQASQWANVHHCHGRHTSALVNGGGFAGAVSAPQFMMPHRWLDGSDCTVREGHHEAILTHVCCEFATYKNCRIHGGAFWQVETTHSYGFRAGGRNTRFIDCVVDSVPGYGFLVFGKYISIINPIIRNITAASAGHSVGIGVAGVNPGGLNTTIQGGFIDGVSMTSGGFDGFGIQIFSGAVGTRIVNHEIRNVDNYGVYIQDTSNTEYIDGLTGVNIGTPAGSIAYLIYATSTNPPPNWHRVSANMTGRAGSAITNQPSGLVYKPASAVSGRAVLVAGTVTVSAAEIQASDNVLLSVVVPGGTRGEIQLGTIVAGTSFVINSIQPGTASTVQTLDTSTVYWEIRH